MCTGPFAGAPFAPLEQMRAAQRRRLTVSSVWPLGIDQGGGLPGVPPIPEPSGVLGPRIVDPGARVTDMWSGVPMIPTRR